MFHNCRSENGANYHMNTDNILYDISKYHTNDTSKSKSRLEVIIANRTNVNVIP